MVPLKLPGKTVSAPLSNTLNWSIYSTVFAGIVFLVVTSLETAMICLFLSFLNSALGYQLSGSSFIIIVYFTLFILVVGLELFGAIEASLNSNTMQVIALSLLNLWNFVYSIIQILQLNSFKRCVDDLQAILVSNRTILRKRIAPAILDLQSKCFFAIADSKTAELPPQSELLDLRSSIDGNRHVLDMASQIQIAICVFMAFASIAGCYLSFKLYQQLGWSQYSLYTHGNIEKRILLERFQLFLLSIKINAFLFLGLSLQMVGVGYIERKMESDVSTAQKEAITQLSLSIILVLLYAVGGIFGGKILNLWALRLFLLVSLVILVYLLFVITHLSQSYKPTLIWTVSFTLLAIVSDLIAMAICYLCIMGHIAELKELLQTPSAVSSSASNDQDGDHANAMDRQSTTKSNRFIID